MVRQRCWLQARRFMARKQRGARAWIGYRRTSKGVRVTSCITCSPIGMELSRATHVALLGHQPNPRERGDASPTAGLVSLQRARCSSGLGVCPKRAAQLSPLAVSRGLLRFAHGGASLNSAMLPGSSRSHFPLDLGAGRYSRATALYSYTQHTSSSFDWRGPRGRLPARARGEVAIGACALDVVASLRHSAEQAAAARPPVRSRVQ